MATSPLPREIVKWLQSLDLSFTVKNPKRDFANGYLVAEILSRYHPKDINMNGIENGTRLAAKVDNWEQAFKLCKKKGVALTKYDIDPVIHCAPGAATLLILKLHHLLTQRAIKHFAPQDVKPYVAPFMRETASTRLKDHEIARIEDRVDRTIKAIDVLGMYHDERRTQKTLDAPLLMRDERRRKTRKNERDFNMASQEEMNESVQVDEVNVKAMRVDQTQIRGGQTQRGLEQQAQGAAGGRSRLMKKVSTTGSAVGALASVQPPALFVKPAADIMRPLVSSIIQEYEDLSSVIDSRKDVVVSFMEQCRDSIPEDTSVRVFETLANRAQLLVDTLTKSPSEFWKVWSTFYPALTDFSESSPVFESAVFLFKRIGDLMREADPPLTQQLITEVGLPSLSKELAKAPEKREALCEVVYSYTQEDTLNHLLVLRALKEKIGDLPVYVNCLACMISLDAQLSLLDEHLLDLYIYYALIAIQSPQPKIRVAGTSILSTITMCSSQHHSVAALIPSFADLAHDHWWEVQAQLLLLSANLLSKLSAISEPPDIGGDDGASSRLDSPTSSATGAVGARGDPSHHGAGAEQQRGGGAAAHVAGGGGTYDEGVTENLLEIIGRLFVVGNSKNVLQVGLSALVPLLPDCPTLLPVFVTVLLGQPAALRRRLLRIKEPGGEAGGLGGGSATEPQGDRAGRLTYVIGSSSRMYEEKNVAALWPHLDVAKTFAMQLEASPLDHWEVEHVEVFLAALPDAFQEDEIAEWLDIFNKVKQYIFVSLVDPDLHLNSTQIIKRFWLCPIEWLATRCIEASKRTLLQALRLLYGASARSMVEEDALLEFLRELQNCDGEVRLEVASVVESFRETHRAEYESSRLASVILPS